FSATRTSADGPRRDQEAAALVSLADHQEVAVRRPFVSLQVTAGGSRCPFGSVRTSGSRDRYLVRLRAGVFFASQQSLQISDVLGGLLGRQVGLHDGFSLGSMALQANYQRQIRPYARIRTRMAIGAAQR